MKIDRKALIQRHNINYAKPEIKAPLSLGNGSFTFTADFTGLQTFFPVYDYFPLCTMSDWSWHTYSNLDLDPSKLAPTYFDTYGRNVGYPVNEGSQGELYYNLRQNPHRYNLAVLGLNLEPESLEECEAISQNLNLWEGILDSKFKLWGEEVNILSLVNSNDDTICLKLSSPLFASGKLKVKLSFPYGSHKKNGSDFSCPDRHKSLPMEIAKNHLTIHRIMDSSSYSVQVFMDDASSYTFDGGHNFTFDSKNETFYLLFSFSPKLNDAGDYFNDKNISARELYEKLKNETLAFWENYWIAGAALDFSSISSPDAGELERRIVLSQYLIAIQERGTLPPAETGLTCNSWYGKFHLEMHYWHSAHIPLWDRSIWLEKSLAWYKRVIGEAKRLAESQGYMGARWIKMCGPGGDNSPSRIAVFLVWQQVHPILLAELCYRKNNNRDFLLEYKEIIIETAKFICDFLHWDGSRYVLGPPVIPAQERFDPRTVLNPGFEVEYFRWGLKMTNTWLERLGEKPVPEFAEAAEKLSLPPVHEGVYISHENCPETFSQKPFNTDHPSMLAMLGILPGEGIDKEIMNATLDRVLKDWDLDSCWGWDFPMMAMCAARLGRKDDAVKFLLWDNPKNTYLPNGHNAQADKADLPLYLPGNGGLLLAAAMMAGGWDHSGNEDAPGFPDQFKPKTEGFHRYI